MKRFGIILLSALLILGVLCGCGAKSETASSSSKAAATTSGHHAEPGEPNHHK